MGNLGWALGWADVGKNQRIQQIQDVMQKPFGSHRTARFAGSRKKRPVLPVFPGLIAQTIF
jgi:hypothetical protein